MNGILIMTGAGISSLRHRVQAGFQAHPASYLLRTGSEDPHPPSDGVKNVWNYTSTSPYIFMAWCWVKHRGKFSFYLIISAKFKIKYESEIHDIWQEVWTHLVAKSLLVKSVVNMKSRKRQSSDVW